MIHASVLGQGPALFILHGFLGSGDNWKTLAKKWSELGREVHLLDARNHGKSFHSDQFSYEIMSEDVIQYAHHNQIKTFDLLGHSMGGKTAQFLALRFPQYLNRLVVVDIASKAYPPHHTEILEALYQLDSMKLSSRKEAEEFLIPLFKDAGLRQFLLKNLERDDSGILSVKCNIELFRNHPTIIGKSLPSDAQIHTPTLFVRGLRSNYITDADLLLLKEQFTHFNLRDIPNAGHWLHAEQPELFDAAIREFLNL